MYLGGEGMKALINITNFQEAYEILAGSKYYYEIMNNISSYIRNIRNIYKNIAIISYFLYNK